MSTDGYWAYRVLQCRTDTGQIYFKVAEVHFEDPELYKKFPEKAISGWTSDPVDLVGEDIGELEWAVKQIGIVMQTCGELSPQSRILREWELPGYEGP